MSLRGHDEYWQKDVKQCLEVVVGNAKPSVISLPCLLIVTYIETGSVVLLTVVLMVGAVGIFQASKCLLEDPHCNWDFMGSNLHCELVVWVVLSSKHRKILGLRK